MDEPLDCLIIGGGPAGLTAATYLARFHLKLKLVDGGKSRAATIPCTHNHAGFPNGISGIDLIARMKEQAQLYGAVIEDGFVSRIESGGGGFVAEWGCGPVAARTVLLATGVSNRRPAMDETAYDSALAAGLIRYCPICDGYEVTDKRVAVIGTGEKGAAETLFLRSFTADLTLFAPEGPHDLPDGDRAALAEAGIRIVDGPVTIESRDDSIELVAAGKRREFASVYPALGSDTHTQLAEMLGARLNEHGCIGVDAHQRTSVPGLYAAGDVVIGLDQISHAMGDGGVAATTIRNDLAKETPLWR
ncbi:MAG TPA: NAD(P)/FAD-dependent oxidoreductase [Sphingomicrobium sp.]|nr:NAD(P)/FAD-dependent oxidoreductase [Sphingomicrobium sp.]